MKWLGWGDTLNIASKLCDKANKESYYKILVSYAIYINLNEHNQNLLNYVGKDYSLSIDYYGGNVVRTDMNEWYKENCK
jgi:class 3 adenylate cyclase